MRTFVDTSAIYALLDRSDPSHDAAARVFPDLVGEGLVTHNYVVIEAVALLQARIGLPAVSTLVREILPVVEMAWVEVPLHETALATLLAGGTRDVSFVDQVSFALMRREALTTAFAFDDDFRRSGFRAVP